MLGEPVSRRELIDVALDRQPPDLLVRGGTLVNVHAGEIYPADVAVKGDRIAAVGDVAGSVASETEVVDASGRYLIPGLVETHLHHCHSSLGVSEFAEAMLMHGVTAFADGFYGPAIVAGADAVRFFKQAFERLPIRLLFLVPVLAYTQNRELGLTPAASISVPEMHEMLDWDGCRGLEEPPPFPILEGWEEMIELLTATLERRQVVTGHAAALDARQTQAYVAAGAQTDHEMVEAVEARRKARAGLRLFARQGDPGCEDAAAVLRAHTELRVNPRCFAFCSDLATADKLVSEGTVDHAVRLAISRGTLPVTAIQMATLNAAEGLSAQHDLGAIAPGRYADLLLVDEPLPGLAITEVIVGGKSVARDGRLLAPLPRTEYPDTLYGRVDLSGPVTEADLTLGIDRPDGEVEVRAIGVAEGESLLFSPERRVTLAVRDRTLHADPAADVTALAIIDRLGRGTGIGLGFAHGFGLNSGAFASTLTAVSMNLVVVGTNPADMAVAANRLAESGGGKVVVDHGEVLAEVGLPVLGLHSDRPMPEVLREIQQAVEAIGSLGCRLADPFSQLEFCFACQDIGDIKLSEEGLLQVRPPRRLEVVVE